MKFVMSFQPVNDRLCYIRLRGRFFNTTLVSAYAPTEDAADEVKENFYADLNRILERSAAYDVKIVCGDLNAKVGREQEISGYIFVAGTESLHEQCNENGWRLVSLEQEKNMVI